MQSVKSKDGNLNLDDSNSSLVNKETQTDTTDSFLENYYVKFPQSQDPSAIQSENSIKLLGYCHKRGEGGTVTIKDNTIFIKETLRRNKPSLIENNSLNTSLSEKSAYCEEVLIPYLKSPPPDCESLVTDYLEDTPDQPDTNTNKVDMKNKKTNNDDVCHDPCAERSPIERPETTELTDVGRGLKYVASAIISPLCKNCQAKEGLAKDQGSNDPCKNSSSTQQVTEMKNQDASDPCKKSLSTQRITDTVSNISQGIKKVASKMMSGICPNKTSEKSQIKEEKPPEKPPETPSPKPVVTKCESKCSVKGAYTACKQKTICIAKGVRRSISDLLCTPCPCPKPFQLPVCCSSPNVAASSEHDPPDCPPKKEEAPISPPAEESHFSVKKNKDDESPCPVVKERSPCPPPEETLPCQPKDVELPPCKKKVIERPPCPPKDDTPPCIPRKEKKCPPKQTDCTPKDKCKGKIKDPVMAVKMPKCKGQKPKYFLTDRSKICKNCEEISFHTDSQHQVNAVTLENTGQLTDESTSNLKIEDINFSTTGNILSLYSLESSNITYLNNEMETKKEITPDLQNQSCINSEPSALSNRLPLISLNNKIMSKERLLNLEKENIISTKASTQSNNVTHLVLLNNEIKSKSDDTVANEVSNNTVVNEDQGLNMKDRLVKSLTNVKESMSYFIKTVHKVNEPTSVLSDESQLIKVTEAASTDNRNPSNMNINRSSGLNKNQEYSDTEENETTPLERASNIITPLVARLADAVDTTMTTLKERLDFDRFSIQDNIRNTTERSSSYDKLGVTSHMTQELSSTDSEPVPDEPSSLPKSVFTTIKSKLFGMFSDRERTDSSSNTAGPVLEKTSKASVRFKNSDGSLD